MDKLFKMLKRPFNGSWDNVESHSEVFEYILLRLPVRNLLMFKCVSKHWRSVISTKDFILMHRHWSERNPGYLVFHDAADSRDGILREMRRMECNGVYSESYALPNLRDVDNPLLIASFNGLICCLTDVSPSTWEYEMDLRVCNPATREVLLIPRGHSSVFNPVFGVMYSTRYHFYKIFKFFSEMEDMKEGYTRCEVYSSQMGEWKDLGRIAAYPLMSPGRPLAANHVCIDEKVYWLVADEDGFDIPTSILMVDMDENFSEIELPNDAEIAFLIAFQGRLCFIVWAGTAVLIWQYYEERNVWELVGEPEFPADGLEVVQFNSVTSVGDDILFVYRDVTGLRHEVAYDVWLETWYEFRIPEDRKDKTLGVFPFFETLLPCSCLGFKE